MYFKTTSLSESYFEVTQASQLVSRDIGCWCGVSWILFTRFRTYPFFILKPTNRDPQGATTKSCCSFLEHGVRIIVICYGRLSLWTLQFLQQVGGQGFVTDCYSKFLSHKKVGSHIVQFWLCKLELAFLPKSNVPHININTLRHTGQQGLAAAPQNMEFLHHNLLKTSLWTLRLAAGSSPFIRQHLNAKKACHEA